MTYISGDLSLNYFPYSFSLGYPLMSTLLGTSFLPLNSEMYNFGASFDNYIGISINVL